MFCFFFNSFTSNVITIYINIEILINIRKNLEKIKMSLINISLIGVITISLSGYFDENVSCSGEAEKDLVKQITLPIAKEKMIAQLLNERNSMNGMLYLSIKKLAETYGTKPNMESFKDLPKIETKVESEYSNVNFLLGDIRTLSKDKELNIVECTGKVTFKTYSYELAYDIEYNSQLGDNKENIFV